MPCLAAGDAVGLEQAHLRPAQAEGIADDVVDLLDARDVVVDEPERLAPERLEQPVADEGLDLAADHDGLHAERGVERHRPLDHFGRGRLARDDLDERQQIDRVERMRDDEPLRMRHPLLQVARQEARGRGADDDLGAAAASIARSTSRLSSSRSGTLSCTKSAPSTAASIEAAKVSRPRGGSGAPTRRVKARSAFATTSPTIALRLGAGIEHRDVDAREQQARDPTRADHPAADAGGLPGRVHQRRSSLSFARTSAGPRIRAPMPCAIATARSTSASFVASTPLSSQRLSSSPTRMLPPASIASPA